MKIYRIHISSWTASFRYPNMISGYQATLPVPPLSTIHGLISAAMGKPFLPEQLNIGFVFQTKGFAKDMETIYQMKWEKTLKARLKNITANIVWREFLVDNELWIYTTNYNVAKSLERPYFPLLLGRSGDLATVHSIDEMDSKFIGKLKQLKGTIIPFTTKYNIAAPIHALPIYFSDEIPRRNLGTKPYYLLESNYRQTYPIAANGIWDEKNEWEVYWQE